MSASFVDTHVRYCQLILSLFVKMSVTALKANRTKYVIRNGGSACSATIDNLAYLEHISKSNLISLFLESCIV